MGGRALPPHHFTPSDFFFLNVHVFLIEKKKKKLKIQAGIFTFPQGLGQCHFSLGKDHSLVLEKFQWTFDLAENGPQVVLPSGDGEALRRSERQRWFCQIGKVELGFC